MKFSLRHILFLLLLATPALAQVDTTGNRGDTTAVPPPRGSAGSTDSLPAAGRSAPPGTYVMTKDPLTATLLSIIPGGGQVYTEQYIKAPIFFGVAAFFAVQAVRYNALFNEQADIYDGLPPGSSQLDRTRSAREFYRDERDQNAAYFIGVTILSMIDAYVGAHLFDFDVEDEPAGGGGGGATSKIYLDPMEQRVGIWLRF